MNINATLFVEIAIFFVFVLLTMEYVWKPILTILEERQRQIVQGLRDADQAQQTLEQAKESGDYIIMESKKQAANIISEAQRKAETIILDSKAACKKLRTQTEKQCQEAQQTMLKQAQNNVQKQITTLCIITCQKILGETNLHKDLENKILTYFSNEGKA